MSRFHIFIFCIIFSLPVLAQRNQQRIAVGDEFFEREQFNEAIEVYERVLQRSGVADERKEISFKIAESYRRLLNYSEARKWYVISLNLGYYDPIIYRHLSEMSLGLEEFETAISYAYNYLEEKPDDDLALKLLESGKFAQENYFKETIFEVSNESGINNPGQQWGIAMLENVAVVHQDQARVDEQFDLDIRLRYNNIFYWVWITRTLKERIIFSSTRPFEGSETNGYSNIFQATFNRRMGDWDKPRLLTGDINSDYYDGFLSYDPVNEIGYFMNSGIIDGNRATADIYTVKYNEPRDTWGTPELFVFNSEEFNVGYPSINEDGTVLYFASDMEGGYGLYDIYKMVKDEDGKWGDPINLGPTINTEFNDSYPFIAGDVLYFSSYGHPGFGGFDVFYSVIDENGEYGNPINMGAPINSSADDFGFVIDENYSRGFFSSSRPGGKGEDDIYSFRVVPKSFQVQGRVTDEITGDPIAGLQVIFYDDRNNFLETTTNQQGFYDMPDLSTDVNYYIAAYPENYKPIEDTLAVRDQLLANRFLVITDYERNFALRPIDHEDDEEQDMLASDLEPSIRDLISRERDGDPFTLSDEDFPEIYFDFGMANLSREAISKLDIIIDFLNDNPGKGVIVHAHTDEISGYLINFYLSQQRAKSVADHLERKGIDPSRIYTIGHGKMELVIPNAQTSEEHRLNRRAQFQSIPIQELNAFLENASRYSFRYLNSIQKEAYFAEGVEFMVQFIASHVPINPQFYRSIMDNIPNVDIIYYYDTDRFHRYLVGSFRDFNSAFLMQRTLRELGYEIYVVAFENGERIPVSRARRLIGEL
jgi:outer membrane protein OmpA-like peptidoglycan-associated protein/tetratricopeptide (TPR) repeat protein